MLHHGREPRWTRRAALIVVDIVADEWARHDSPVDLMLVGDASSVLYQLSTALFEARHVSASAPLLPATHPWREALAGDARRSVDKLLARLQAETRPIDFFCAYGVVRDCLGRLADGAIVVSEGANTMDIGRIALPVNAPRSRLDAATWGTMGVGLGYAVAAAVALPGRLIVALEGDR